MWQQLFHISRNRVWLENYIYELDPIQKLPKDVHHSGITCTKMGLLLGRQQEAAMAQSSPATKCFHPAGGMNFRVAARSCWGCVLTWRWGLTLQQAINTALLQGAGLPFRAGDLQRTSGEDQNPQLHSCSIRHQGGEQNKAGSQPWAEPPEESRATRGEQNKAGSQPYAGTSFPLLRQNPSSSAPCSPLQWQQAALEILTKPL